MDADLWIQYLLKHGIRKIKKTQTPLAKFRLHESSKSVSLNPEFIKERWTLRMKLIEQFSEVSYDLAKLGKDRSSKIALPDYPTDMEVSDSEMNRLLHLSLLRENYANGNLEVARKLFSRSRKYLDWDLRTIKMFVKLFLTSRIFS